MPYGGRNPYPRRYGGGKSTQQAIYESLNLALGTGFDTTDASTVTAETSADARTIAALWSANRRLANSWDPRRMTDPMLARAERIFGVRPRSTDSDNRRRARLVAKFIALGGDTAGTLDEICEAILGDIFIELERTSLTDSHSNWPGGTPAVTDRWDSTVAHLLIRIVRPEEANGITQAEFFARCDEVMLFMRDYTAAWMETDRGCFNTAGTRGFLLDEKNLDLETLT